MELIKIKRNDILGFVNSTVLIQPDTYLEVDNSEDCKVLSFAIECYNSICKTNIARIRQYPAFDLPEKLGVDKGSEKLYFSVIVVQKLHYGALVSDKDLLIPEKLEECLQNKNTVQLDVNERLKDLCVRLAYANGIKVYNNPDGVGFYFSYDKVVSLYQKLKDAVSAGERKMSFHFNDVKEYTVRSYATRLKKETGVLSRVKVSGKITTLYFGGETYLDLAEPDLRQLIYKYNGDISREEWEIMFSDMMKECFDKKLPDPIIVEPEWQRLGYDSQQEWSDHMKEKKEASNDDWPAPGDALKEKDSLWKEDDDWN